MSQKKSILIVDDEPGSLKLTSLQVEAAGYEVCTAASGRDALSEIRKKRPDLLVLDVMLPGVDGYEVAKLIKHDRKTKGMPIIMLTARNSEMDQLNSVESGALYFITKPYDPVNLLGKIKLALEECAVEQGIHNAKDDETENDQKVKKKILLVDDEPDCLEVLSLRLRNKGYEISTASSGRNALVEIRKIAPDLVILDVMMPGLNGYEIAKLIKNDQKTKDMPIIMLTGRDSERDQLNSKEVGALYFITKPYDLVDFLRKIETALKG